MSYLRAIVEDMKKKVKQHGTYSSYNSGCHCELCTAAKREYGRHYRARNAARIKACIEAGEPLPENIPHGSAGGYTNFGCRCEDCTKAQREADRLYRKNNPEKVRAYNAEYAARLKRTPFELIPHGTFGGYSTYACRCDDCRKANTERARLYRDANREKFRDYAAKQRAKMRQSANVPHGSTHGYSNYGCRCDECRAAMREYGRRRQAAKRAAAEVATVTPIRQSQPQPAVPDDLAA